MPFQIVRNDITKMQVDVIVNSANPQPVIGSGVDAAIYRGAGSEKLLAKRKKIGVISTGECAVTPAFELPAKKIIHTVGPIWQGGNFDEKNFLYKCYENALLTARTLRYKSIAFPLISSGVYGYPKAEAIQIAINAISEFLMKYDMLVYLVVYDHNAFQISGKLFQNIESYIDEHYIDTAKSQLHSYWETSDASIPYDNREAQRRLVYQTSDRSAYEPKEMSVLQKKPTIKRKRNLEDVVGQLGETFQQCLFRLMDEREMTDVEVYKKANIDRKLFSKIRCNANYKPKKKTALALAIALELNLDETRDLLGRAELALSPSSKFDLIISYFIQNEVYDIYTINMALFQYEQPILGE